MIRAGSVLLAAVLACAATSPTGSTGSKPRSPAWSAPSRPSPKRSGDSNHSLTRRWSGALRGRAVAPSPARAAATSRRSLTLSAERAAATVAAGSGLKLDVVRAWVALESSYGSSSLATRAHNYLGLKGCPSLPGGFCTYPAPEIFGAAVVAQLFKPRYAGVIASRTKGAAQQIAALAASPWCGGAAGCPNYAAGLTGAYVALTGRQPGSTFFDGTGPVALPPASSPPKVTDAQCENLRRFANAGKKCPDAFVTKVCDAWKAGRLTEAQAYNFVNSCDERSQSLLDKLLLSPPADALAGAIDSPWFGVLRRGGLIVAGAALGFYALHLLTKNVAGLPSVPSPIALARKVRL